MIPTMMEQVEQLIQNMLDPEGPYRDRLESRKWKRVPQESLNNLEAVRQYNWEISKRKMVYDALPQDGAWISFEDLQAIFPECERLPRYLSRLASCGKIQKVGTAPNSVYRIRK